MDVPPPRCNGAGVFTGRGGGRGRFAGPWHAGSLTAKTARQPESARRRRMGRRGARTRQPVRPCRPRPVRVEATSAAGVAITDHWRLVLPPRQRGVACDLTERNAIGRPCTAERRIDRAKIPPKIVRRSWGEQKATTVSMLVFCIRGVNKPAQHPRYAIISSDCRDEKPCKCRKAASFNDDKISLVYLSHFSEGLSKINVLNKFDS